MGVGKEAGDALGSAITKASPAAAAVWLLSFIAIGCIVLLGVQINASSKSVAVGTDRWTGEDMRKYIESEDLKREARWGLLFTQLTSLSNGVRDDLKSHEALPGHRDSSTRLALLEAKLTRIQSDIAAVQRAVDSLKGG